MAEEKEHLTVDEFWEKYGEESYELIAGVPVEIQPHSSAKTSIVLDKLAELLDEFLDEQEDSNDILVGNVGFAVTNDTLLAADLAVISGAKLAKITDPESYVPFAPDLAIEVVARDALEDELTRRAGMFLAAGTSAVWVVHPAMQKVVVYKPDQKPFTLTGGDLLDGGIVLPGFSLKVRKLFLD